MKYVALRELTFDEVTYQPGEIIPDGVVDESASLRLLRTFRIAAVVEQSGGGGSSGNEYGNYTIEETIVGRWINGKPVYRQCIRTTTPSSTTSSTSHDVTSFNIDSCVDIRAITNSDASVIPVPYVNYDNTSIRVLYDISSKSIKVGTSIATLCSQPIIIFLQYTKTTDEATITI